MPPTRRRNIAPAKPGELRMQWGTVKGARDADTCYVWGPGVERADARLLDHAVFLPRYDHWGRESPSLADELTARGYDLRTLRVSVRKLAPTEEGI
jgi:hypothetical protein